VGVGKEVPAKIELQHDIIPNIQLGDWNRIVLDLRILSFEGEPYKYKSQCPSCKLVSKFAIDLRDIENVYALSAGEPQLPLYEMRNGMGAQFRSLVVRDQTALADIGKDEKDALKKSLALRLVSIDGEMVDTKEGASWRVHVAKAVKLMKAKGLVAMGETEKIRAWFKEETLEESEGPDGEPVFTRKAIDAKIDNILEDTCPAADCRTKWRHYMEIDPSFLLPSLVE